MRKLNIAVFKILVNRYVNIAFRDIFFTKEIEDSKLMSLGLALLSRILQTLVAFR